MATTDFDFNLTRTQIIERAFRLCGALSTGQSLTSNQFTQGNIALNAMVKEWKNEHVHLWDIREATQALSSGDADYAIEDDPAMFDIVKASLRITGHNDRPLEVISWREYFEIPDRTSGGDPTHVCIDARVSPTIYVWPTPNQSGRTLAYLGIVKGEDFAANSDTYDGTTRWLNALCFGLAADLAPEVGLDLNERRSLRAEADNYFGRAKRGDRVNTTRTTVQGYL